MFFFSRIKKNIYLDSPPIWSYEYLQKMLYMNIKGPDRDQFIHWCSLVSDWILTLSSQIGKRGSADSEDLNETAYNMLLIL